jgi:hypothetical protein
MLTKKAKSEKLRENPMNYFIAIEGLPYAGLLSMNFNVHMGNLG